MRKTIFFVSFLLLVVFVSALIEPISNEYSNGWVEYIDNDYSQSSPLTITTASGVNTFSMVNYTTREKELPLGTTNKTFFNGSKVFIRTAGDLFIERWRFDKRTTAGTGGYCEVFYDIGGGVSPLPIRQISTPRATGVWQSDHFTNLQYGLDTWKSNGANITIQCFNQNFDFANIQFTYQTIHNGRGVY